MKRPDFQEKTEVKIIDKDYVRHICINGVEKTVPMYGWRGNVTEVLGFDADWKFIEKPYSPERYPTNWKVIVQFKSPIDGEIFIMSFRDWKNQLQPVQKKFIDIDYIRENDLVIGKKEDGSDAIRPKNTGCFEPGDIIQISTKIDGANASISWDKTTESLEVFSRTNLLNGADGLRGFLTYIRTQVEPTVDWSLYEDFVFFGEWCIKHSVLYNKDWYNKWRIYDIWCKSTRCYISQERVKAMCKQLGLEYIEELYFGPFISWDHCRSFLHASKMYGSDQEGIVIKNQTKLGNPDNRNPVYIKIVNESFKESHHSKKPPKEIDPEAEAAKKRAIELTASIVTEARVRKHILKLIDEGKLPETLTPKDMGSVMKQLPKLIYADCIKEEMETVKQIGENAGKFISAETAKHARKLVIGK